MRRPGRDADRPGADLGTTAHESARRLGAIIATATAAGLHAVVGYFYAASGLVVPLWALWPLWAVWILLAVALWRLRHRPALVLAVPFVAAFVWFVVLWLGDALLGWQA